MGDIGAPRSRNVPSCRPGPSNDPMLQLRTPVVPAPGLDRAQNGGPVCCARVHRDLHHRTPLSACTKPRYVCRCPARQSKRQSTQCSPWAVVVRSCTKATRPRPLDPLQGASLLLSFISAIPSIPITTAHYSACRGAPPLVRPLQQPLPPPPPGRVLACASLQPDPLPPALAPPAEIPDGPGYSSSSPRTDTSGSGC